MFQDYVIKMKVAGTDREFGQLLMKARFEEAKSKILLTPNQSVSNVFFTGPTKQIKVATHPLEIEANAETGGYTVI